jgi:CVNH domain-containing protein
MRRTIFCTSAILAAVAATPALAASSFQNTCSNVAFVYSGNNAALDAVCLRANGTPNHTTLNLPGISNQNGNLVQGSGASTFQESCGHILINVVDFTEVTLSAFCRKVDGSFNRTSVPLNNISNQNGVLTQ